jgi:alpha-ketoglutarate-dependent taurine dioxygenase
MDHRYTGVVTRTLRDEERRVPTSEAQTPLVIEPLQARDATFLQEFLESHSSELMEDIATHGAVLLRGFDVTSPADFERQVLSIRGMHGMNEVLMSEEGRTVVDGTRFVLYTNANFKTGGTLEIPVFHNENYYVPDVPRFISFFCQTPSWLGGETGLVNTAQLYADLAAALRAKLEQRALAVREYRVADVVERYGFSAAEIQDFCARVGIETTTRDGQQYLVIYKPSVIEHPTTHERALVLHISGELNRVGLQTAATEAFAADYAGLPWAVHKCHWRFPSVIWNAKLAGGLITKPRTSWPLLMFKFVKLSRKLRLAKPRPPAAQAGPRVGDLFDPQEIQLVARAMRRRYSSFTWQRGDVLMIDNLKMAHAGMPGFGPRNLKALICNCVPLPCGRESSGLHAPRPDDVRESLGYQLVAYRENTPAAVVA